MLHTDYQGNTRDLIKVNTAQKEKDVTAKHIYWLIEKDKLDGVKIDGAYFVIRNDKYNKYEKEK